MTRKLAFIVSVLVMTLTLFGCYQSIGLEERYSEVIPAKYDFILDFSDGLAAVVVKDGYDYKRGFIYKTGEEVIPLIYGSVQYFSEGLAWVSLDSEYPIKYSLIDTSGNEVLPPTYYMVSPFSDGLSVVSTFMDGYSGTVIDKTGEVVISDMGYDFIHNFSEGFAAATYDIPDSEYEDSELAGIYRCGQNKHFMI
ncbi:MAG: WG repeat-containing protein [Oscillospiraceae bacterium]|nr:WG repeat-containing protein [Oscillospiraceae bacterium]